MCGTAVNAYATECPGCGEQFSPIDNGEPASESSEEAEYTEEYEETVFEEVQETDVPEQEFGDAGELYEPVDETVIPEDELEVPDETDVCQDCGSPIQDDGTCPECTPPEIRDEATDGCPICGSKGFSVESGDLVSCSDCGNVYIRKEYGGAEQSWKWKFWVGLIFIIIGDIGVALGSYVHNVMEWSPLGNMYLGYGWLDQFTGVLGIVLFIVGLVLFAWSFKREREVQCPSCKVIVLESDLTEVEEEEEEELPEELAVESALEEIDETVECPGCGAEVSMFDASCPNCGVLFEMEEGIESEIDDALPMEVEELDEPIELKHGSELDEDEMIMESLELDGPEESVEPDVNELEALNELESAFDAPLEDEMETVTCPSCGAMVGKGLDTCPGCGAAIVDNGGE